MRTESGQNSSKRGHIGKNSGPVQIRAGRTLLWTQGILPKSTTMAVSVHAQWQIRQEKPKRKHGAFATSSHSKENSHVQLLHTSHSHPPRCKINKQKSTDEALGGAAAPSPPLGYATDDGFFTRRTLEIQRERSVWNGNEREWKSETHCQTSTFRSNHIWWLRSHRVVAQLRSRRDSR